MSLPVAALENRSWKFRWLTAVAIIAIFLLEFLSAVMAEKADDHDHHVHLHNSAEHSEHTMLNFDPKLANKSKKKKTDDRVTTCILTREL